MTVSSSPTTATVEGDAGSVTGMGVTVREADQGTHPALCGTYGVLALVLIALLCGSVGLALRESASATSIPGVLLSVDHRNGGDSGTGQVTVQYVDGSGHRGIAHVVMTLRGWPSLTRGTPIAVFVRDGTAVDEPDPVAPTLMLAALQAGILWLLVVLAMREFGFRSAPADRGPRR